MVCTLTTVPPYYYYRSCADVLSVMEMQVVSKQSHGYLTPKTILEHDYDYVKHTNITLYIYMCIMEAADAYNEGAGSLGSC